MSEDKQLNEFLLPSEKIAKVKYPIGGYAPGHYLNNCVSCDEKFMGDKYAKQCQPCAINSVNESNSKVIAQLYRLKSALKNIKSSNDVINEIIGE